MGSLLLPHYEVPEGKTLDGYLRELVLDGMKRRYGEVTPELRPERAEYELGVIGDMGFAGYFLVVQDFVNWAKNQGIRVGPGRGSAAGSIVSYSLGITELDPLRYDLMFERFLNPERIEMPDIDIDFDERRRGDVIRYVTDKYGDDHVAQIVTFGTIKGKQAIKDAARVLGFPYAGRGSPDEDVSAADHGPRRRAPMRLSRVSRSCARRTKRRGAAKEIIDTALRIENLKRSAGIHAAGVVIGRDPLVEHVPLKRGDHDEVVTQFDMNGVEELGLLKMDFLGLRNLTVIEVAKENMLRNKEVEVDVDDLDLADPTRLRDVAGGGLGRGLPARVGWDAATAGPAPPREASSTSWLSSRCIGPARWRRSRSTSSARTTRQGRVPAPGLEDLTKETYGVLVYQEQIVHMLQKLAGYTPGKADMVRKAIGKKNRDIMATEEPRFLEGCTKSGMDEAGSEELWGHIQPFADYSFNRAHTACYAYVAYQTA